MRPAQMFLMCAGLALLLLPAPCCTLAVAQEAEPPAANDEQPAQQPAEAPAGEAPTEPLQPAPANFDFEADELGPYWFTLAQDGNMKVTREAQDVRDGTGALLFTYMPAEGALALAGATPVKADAQPRSLRFSLKTQELSAILYGVNEADGSSYQGYCYTPGGRWLDLLIDLDELMLSEDTTDENDQLDADQINQIIIADLCNLPGEVGRALGVKHGLQSMCLDNLALTEQPAPKRSSRGANADVIVDDFDGDLAVCLPIGAPELTLVPGPRPGDQALKVAYRLGGHRWVGLVRAVGYLDLAQASKFCFTLNAGQSARLVVVLEERDGSKYETYLELDPAQGWHEVVVPVAQFMLDPNTQDENAQVDVAQLRVIIFVADTFNASVDAEGLGWYTISSICFR
jgi:hypothetical protein